MECADSVASLANEGTNKAVVDEKAEADGVGAAALDNSLGGGFVAELGE